MNPNLTNNKDLPAVGGSNRLRIMSTNNLGAGDMILGGANSPVDKFETETVNTDMVGAAGNHLQNNMMNVPR